MKQVLVFGYYFNSKSGSDDYYYEVVLRNKTTRDRTYIGTIVLSGREFHTAKERGTIDETLYNSAIGLLLDSVKKSEEE